MTTLFISISYRILRIYMRYGSLCWLQTHLSNGVGFIFHIKVIIFVVSIMEIERSFVDQHLSIASTVQQSSSHLRSLILAISMVFVKHIGCTTVWWCNNSSHYHLGRPRSMSMHPMPCQAEHSSMVVTPPMACWHWLQTRKSLNSRSMARLNR